MRRIAYGVVTSSLLWSIAGPVSAQTMPPLRNFNLYGGGTRAHSMGGAFYGLADDGSAATWNPAGLTQNDRIYAVLDWGLARQEVTNTLESPENLPYLFDNTSTRSILHFNYLAFNGPLTLKGQRFHLAATWTRDSHDDYESEYQEPDPASVPIPVPDDVTLDALGLSQFTQGGPEHATLAMATQIAEEKFSVGFGLNIFMGNQFDSTRVTVDAEQAGFKVRSITDEVDRQDFSGVNFNVGALFQARQFSVGVTARTPFKLESRHDGREAEFLFERTTDSVLLIAANSRLVDFVSQIEMPLQLGVGFTYRPQDNLILAADYEYKGFASSKLYMQEDLLDPKSDLLEIDPEFTDVHQIRLGMEYQIGVGWGVVPVRAGFRTEPQPYSHWVDVNQSLSTGEWISSVQGDQVTGEVYALGTGLEWRQVRFDLGWELTTITQYTSGYLSGSFLLPQIIGTRESLVQKLTLGFTGYF